MLLNILGWLWVVTGIFFLLKPHRFRERLQKKSVKKLKRFFFGLTLTLGVLLIGATWGVPGILARVVMILGIIGIIKAFFLLKAKAANALIEWYVSQSLKFFRMCAVIQIIMGAIILTA